MKNPDAVPANPALDAHVALIASLPSSIPLDESTAMAFRALQDRRNSLEKTLQAAIQAAVEAAQNLGLAIDTETQALWFETLTKAGADMTDQSWSIDAGDPKRTYLLKATELHARQQELAPQPPFANTQLAVSQEVIAQVRNDLEAEIGRPCTLEELQARLDGAFGAGHVALSEREEQGTSLFEARNQVQ